VIGVPTGLKSLSKMGVEAVDDEPELDAEDAVAAFGRNGV